MAEKAAVPAGSSGSILTGEEEQEMEEGEMLDEDEEEEEEEEEEFLPGYQTMQDYSKALLGKVVQATKAANGLPNEGDDFDYYSSFPGFRTFCNKMESRVTRSIGRLIRHQALPCYWSPSQAPPTSMPTPDGDEGAGSVATTTGELEERMEAIVEANDILLERVGVLLDEACGLRKKEELVPAQGLQQGTAEVASWNKKRDSVREPVASYSFMTARNVPRPQLKFRDHVDNSNSPHIPLLRSKPNALQPLPEVFQRLLEPLTLNSLISNSKEWALEKHRCTHPYQYELENLEPIEEQLQLSEPQAPGSLEEVPYTFIDTEEGLEQLLEELKKSKEFAIDLENHSYRSFQGFVCLMQVSTRSHDYIVDTLELRHYMHRLLDPFTNPHIVKVMHGADWDIPWLQRDFGLYVVNLFDTGQASRVLSLPKFSLAFLLQYCCGVEANKQYQLADWRIRPLPAEMEKYAREDTHYLLYIYDRMRNELIRRSNAGQSLLHTTLSWSRNVCLKTYKKQVFSEDGYLKLYFKHKRSFNSQQLRCLQLLYKWRDHVAREEDEGQGYILPNHMLFQISEQLPREAQGVLACCTPIPTLLRQQLQEVFMAVQEARETTITNELPKLAPPRPAPPAPASAPPTLTPSHLHSHLPTSPTTVTTHTEPLNEHHSVNHHVETRGPPVKQAAPSLAIMETVCPELGSRVKEQLLQIESSFPNVLAQFLEARPMATSEVLLSQTASAETPGEAARVQATPPDSEATALLTSGAAMSGGDRVKDSETVAKATNGAKGLKSKRILSIREMGSKRRKVSPPKQDREARREEEEEEEVEEGELVGEGTEVKRRRLEGVVGRPGFTPFDYKGAKFTDYTMERSHPAEVFQPYSSSGGGRGRRGGGARGGSPRSKVHMKSGERTYTYSK